MRPILDSYAASGLGGVSGDLAWQITIGNLGKNGLIAIAWLGREEGGEQNPEEINAVSFNGINCPIIREENNQETGHGMAILRGASLPGPGTYTVSLNFQDSPKQAEKKRGVVAAFRNIRDETYEAINGSAGASGARSAPVTTLTPNALVIASFGWRVGFAETWSGGMTPIVTSRGDNSAGVSLAYAIKEVPGLITPSCDAGNTESDGMVAAVYKPAKDRAGMLTAFLD